MSPPRSAYGKSRTHLISTLRWQNFRQYAHANTQDAHLRQYLRDETICDQTCKAVRNDGHELRFEALLRHAYILPVNPIAKARARNSTRHSTPQHVLRWNERDNRVCCCSTACTLRPSTGGILVSDCSGSRGPLQSLLLLPCPAPSKMSRNSCTTSTTPPPPSALRNPPTSSFLKPPSSPPPPLAPGRAAASVSWPCGTG